MGDKAGSVSLIFREGPRKDEEIPLTGSSYKIGSSSGCDIVLEGRLVDAVHAVLEDPQGGGAWRIADRGKVGLLVNGERVAETALLFDGDTIQIGNDHLIELRDTPADAPTEKKKRRSSKKKGGLLQSPWFYVGLVLFYGGFFGAVYMAVQHSADAGGEALTPATAFELLCRSERYLEDLPRSAQSFGPAQDEAESKSGSSDGEETMCSSDDDEAAEDSWISPPGERLTCEQCRRELGVLHQEEPAPGRDTRIERILAQLHRDLFDAWLLEAQGRFSEAAGAYQTVVDCFPDVALPATRFAIERRTLILADR